MSDPTTLTPPADAPLPWRDLSTSETYDDDHDDRYLVDANGDAVVFVDDEATMGVVGYLVACANAAPTLVEDLRASDRLAVSYARTIGQVALAMSCEPADDADLVEAARLLVKERDAAVQHAADIERAIVHWLRVKSAEQVDRAKLAGWHPDDAGYVDALHDAAEAIEAGAWRGKEAP